MSNARSETSAYRERGYACRACGVKILVMGDDAAPTSCPSCDSAAIPVVEWDHDVETKSTVKDHVEPN